MTSWLYLPLYWVMPHKLECSSSGKKTRNTIILLWYTCNSFILKYLPFIQFKISWHFLIHSVISFSMPRSSTNYWLKKRQLNLCILEICSEQFKNHYDEIRNGTRKKKTTHLSYVFWLNYNHLARLSMSKQTKHFLLLFSCWEENTFLHNSRWCI